MAQSHNYLAEGVEYNEAAKLFKEQQCEYGRGYYWSKPLNYDEFVNFALVH